jgi:hypothetical protein
MGPIVAQMLVQLSHVNGVFIKLTEPNSAWSHDDWCKFRFHLTSVIISHLEWLKLLY